MRLLNNYKNIITEELLKEDRTEAKTLLKKVGITIDGWKVNNEDPDNFIVVNFIKSLDKVITGFGEAKLLGELTGFILELFESNAHRSGLLNDIKQLEQEGLIKFLTLSRELKKNIPDTIFGYFNHKDLYRSFDLLKISWASQFEYEYVGSDTIDRLRNIPNIYNKNAYFDLGRKLEEIADSEKLRRDLIKNKTKLKLFNPIDDNGNERSDEEIVKILDYLDGVIEPPYDNDDMLNLVKTNTPNDIVWEGDGQLIIQITEDNVKHDIGKDTKEKVCHGSQNWCIINSPGTFWKGSAGDSTYILFNRDKPRPYNRIIIIVRGGGIVYWDENDNIMSEKKLKQIPNIDEIDTILNSKKKTW